MDFDAALGPTETAQSIDDFGRDLTDLDLSDDDDESHAKTDDENGDDLSDEQLLQTDDDERADDPREDDDELQTDDEGDIDADNHLAHIQLDNEQRDPGQYLGFSEPKPTPLSRPLSPRPDLRRVAALDDDDDEFTEMGFSKEAYYGKRKVPRRDLKKLLVAEKKARDAVLHAEAVNLAIHDEKAADLFSFRSSATIASRTQSTFAASSLEVKRWLSGKAEPRDGAVRRRRDRGGSALLLSRPGSFLNQKPEEVERLTRTSMSSRTSSLQTAFIFDTRLKSTGTAIGGNEHRPGNKPGK